MTDDACVACRFFHERVIENNTKTFCRRRLHSGSMGSKLAGAKLNMAAGRMSPTGERREMVASYFPETRPDWWCGEFENALDHKPSPGVKPKN